MSQFTPESIKSQITAYDTIVREAVRTGNLSRVAELEDQIKTFYKTCMRFTDPERQAAFNLPLFLHGFLKDFRKKKDEENFLEDQRLRLKKYDDKRRESFLSKKVVSAGQQGSSTAADDVATVMSATAAKRTDTAVTTTTAEKVSTAARSATAVKSRNAATSQTAAMSTAITPASTSNDPATTSNASHKNDENNTTAAFLQREVDDPMDGSPSPIPPKASSKPVAKLFPPITKPRTLSTSSPAQAVLSAATTVNPLNLPINSSIKSKPPLHFRRTKPTVSATPGQGPRSAENATTDTVDRFKQPLTRPKPALPSRPSKAPVLAVPGPGPRSMEISAARIMRNSRVTPADLDQLHPMEQEDVRKFRDIEEEGSSESDDYDVPRPPLRNVKVEGKGKMRASEVTRKRPRVSSGDEERLPSMNVVSRKRVKSALALIKNRGKVEDRDERESEESVGKSRFRGNEYEDDEEDYSVIKSRPVKYIPRQEKKPTIHRSPSGQYYPIPTGEYHDDKCSRCRITERSCEIQKSGGACVNCRRYKHKCEYSRPRARKEVKSKPFVESEDESAVHFSPPPPSRLPRAASAVARKAIKKAVIASEIGSKTQLKRARSNARTIPRRSEDITADPYPIFSEKLDTIIDHLGNISQYLQRLCEYQEGMDEETPDENPPPPASDRPRPTLPPFRRLDSSPLTSPMPSPPSNRVIELDDVDMAPPPGTSGSQPQKPNVVLIQPTPENSQKNSGVVTQLFPTPQRPSDDISLTGPAATLPGSPLQTSSFAALTIVDNPIPPVSADNSEAIIEATVANQVVDVEDATTNVVAVEGVVMGVEDTTANVQAVEGVIAVEVLNVESSQIPTESPNAATVNQAAEIEKPLGEVENSMVMDISSGDVAPSEDVPNPQNTADISNAAAGPGPAENVGVALGDDLSTQTTEERQKSPDVVRIPSPTLSLGPAARTRSRSRSQNPEGSTLGIPVVTRSRSLSPLPGDKRKAEVDDNDGNSQKKRRS